MKLSSSSLNVVEVALLAIPFYYLWNYFAPIYLPNLPTPYLDIPFWHCVGLFILVWILRVVVIPGGSIVAQFKGRGWS